MALSKTIYSEGHDRLLCLSVEKIQDGEPIGWSSVSGHDVQLEDLLAQIDLSILERVDYPMVYVHDCNFEVNWQTLEVNGRLLNTE